MRLLFCILLATIYATNAFSQQDDRVPVPPEHQREADIMISKRHWRIIDLREKQNTEAVWPRNPINRILYEAAINRKLKPYRTDSLQSVFDIEEFSQRRTSKLVVRKLIDPNDNDGAYTSDTVYEPFLPEERIKHLLLMEEWVFDKKMGKEFVRIIAIAPLFRLQVEGIDLGLQPLCWFRYNDRFEKETDCRDILVNQVMFNAQNSRTNNFTYDDWFEQRRFSSYIIKISNQYDISIMDDPEVKQNGIRALIEAARLKQDTHEREINIFED